MAQTAKNLPADAGDKDSDPVLGRQAGGGNGNHLQYSCLKNPVDRGDWQETVHGVEKSWTRLSDYQTCDPSAAISS